MAFEGDKKREYQNQWIKNRREDFFRGKKCELCGTTNRLVVIRKDKRKPKLHGVWSKAMDKMYLALRNARVLCWDCNGKIRRKTTWKHGISGYKDRKCRCKVCTEAVKIAWREYRAYKKMSKKDQLAYKIKKLGYSGMFDLPKT